MRGKEKKNEESNNSTILISGTLSFLNLKTKSTQNYQIFLWYSVPSIFKPPENLVSFTAALVGVTQCYPFLRLLVGGGGGRGGENCVTPA